MDETTDAAKVSFALASARARNAAVAAQLRNVMPLLAAPTGEDGAREYHLPPGLRREPLAAHGRPRGRASPYPSDPHDRHRDGGGHAPHR